jgi:mycofactocin system glycosyltransferase
LRSITQGGVPVIVVDDGSRQPHTTEHIVARHGARIVRRPIAGGPAAARNTGLAATDTAFVAFLDSDCVAPQYWLESLLGHFDDPLVAAVSPRVRPSTRADRRLVDRYLAARSPIDMGPDETAVSPGGTVGYLPAAAMILRRSAAERVFDEDLRYGEDVDMVWRLLAAGWRVRYDPQVIILHDEPRTLRSALTRRFRYGTSAGKLDRRHPGRVAPARLHPLPALVALLSARRHPVQAAALAVLGTHRLGRRLTEAGLPRRAAPRWFAEATFHAAVSLSRYIATFGTPAVLVWSWRTRSARPALPLAVAALAEWPGRECGLDPLRWILLVSVDDACYGAGVISGCVAASTLGPLLPILAWRAPR